MDGERLDVVGGFEVAILVKHVVAREERFVAPADDTTALTEGGGVEEAFALARGIAIHEPDEHGETAGGQGGDTIQQVEVHVDEARVVQEVTWRVPRRGELREDDQIRLDGLRAANRVCNFREVCVEGANREVQLSKRESH